MGIDGLCALPVADIAAPDSPNHINAMDIQLDMDSGESPFSMKADFLLSLCELVVGGKEGLQPIEKTVIDRCVRQVYRELTLGIGDGKMPLLQDLYEELLKQPELEAQRDMRELVTIKGNVDHLLGVTGGRDNKEQAR